jgi:hypothetical protein
MVANNYRTPEPLNRIESERFGALKSDSTHHFFRNACTKSVLTVFRLLTDFVCLYNYETFNWEWLFQDRKVGGHVFVCRSIDLAFSTIFLLGFLIFPMVCSICFLFLLISHDHFVTWLWNEVTYVNAEHSNFTAPSSFINDCFAWANSGIIVLLCLNSLRVPTSTYGVPLHLHVISGTNWSRKWNPVNHLIY